MSFRRSGRQIARLEAELDAASGSARKRAGAAYRAKKAAPKVVINDEESRQKSASRMTIASSGTCRCGSELGRPAGGSPNCIVLLGIRVKSPKKFNRKTFDPNWSGCLSIVPEIPA